MSVLDVFGYLIDLLAVLLLALGLKGLSTVRSARSANGLAALAMGLAVLGLLLQLQPGPTADLQGIDALVQGLAHVAVHRLGWRMPDSLRARSQLVDLDSGRIVLDATAGADAGIDVVSSEYATIAAENTALENLSKEVADRIVTQLALDLRKGAAAGSQ